MDSQPKIPLVLLEAVKPHYIGAPLDFSIKNRKLETGSGGRITKSFFIVYKFDCTCFIKEESDCLRRTCVGTTFPFCNVNSSVRCLVDPDD